MSEMYCRIVYGRIFYVYCKYYKDEEIPQFMKYLYENKQDYTHLYILEQTELETTQICFSLRGRGGSVSVCTQGFQLREMWDANPSIYSLAHLQ